MKNITLLLLLSTTLLFAYSNNDYDWDGVDDKYDKCPKSLFSDIVDKDGCRVSSTKSEHHFDIMLGVSQLKSDEYENLTNSLQLDYYYKDFTLSLSNSQYDYEFSDLDYKADGQNDYYLNANYRLKPTEDFSVYLKAGALVPANSDVPSNKTDFLLSTSLNYSFTKDFSTFAGYTHTFMNNEDTNTTTYQDYDSVYVGASYKPTYKSNLSLSYAYTTSIYEDGDELNFLYLTGSYYFNRNWFAILNFGQELESEDKEQYSSVQLGYYF